MNTSRRSFLKKAVAAGTLATAIPTIVSAAIPSNKKNKESFDLIRANDIILFQGDSITDAGRDRTIMEPNRHSSFGNGYAFLVATRLLQMLPEKRLSFYNRGISGNKVYQLSDRWQKDCLSLHPNILSILVGVNDFWHTLTHNYRGTVEVYENDLLGLLRNTNNLMPGVKYVIGEPFAVKGCSAVNDSWYPEFDKYRAAAKGLPKKWMQFLFLTNRYLIKHRNLLRAVTGRMMVCIHRWLVVN